MDRERPPPPGPEWLPPPPGGLGIPPTPAPPPAPRSTVRIAVVLGTLFVIGAVGGFGVAALLDDPDEASSSDCEDAGWVSPTFAYCLDPPPGWESSSAAQEPSGVDAHRAGLDDTVVYVEAVRLDEGLDLRGFADSMRVNDTMSGYAVTDPESATLGGAPSLEWEAVRSVAGDEIVVREIVAVRDGIAWRLQITDTGSTGAPRLYEVRQMLGTWRFA